MRINITIIEIILTIGVAQGIFLTFLLLLIKKGNFKANQFLALFIFSFSLLTIGDVLYESRLLLSYPHFCLVFDPLLFVLSPLCYFYVKKLTDVQWKFQIHHLLHFLPVILLYLLFSTIYFTSAEDKEKIIIEDYNGVSAPTNIFLILSAIQMLTYLLINLKIIRLNARKTKDYYSNQETVNLKWLKHFLALTFILWTAFVASSIFSMHQIVDVSNLLFTITVYLIGYFAIKQPFIFFNNEGNPNEKTLCNSVKKKYASSTLSDEVLEKSVIELVEMVRKDKIFLNSELKLTDLAEKMNMSTHQLSQIINEKIKMNFNDFINDFRVEEFKLRLVDNAYCNHKIMAIGLDCGFNSKATMNAVFKKHTGKSPSEYKKIHSTKN